MIDEKTGYAIVGEGGQEGGRLPNGTSIFSAELHAIFKAVELAKYTDKTYCIICTDSLSSILALKKIYSNDQLCMQIRDKIQKLSFIKFHLIWVPSHKSILGNEKADYLAKTMSELPDCHIEHFPVTLKDYKAAVRKHFRIKFEQSWSFIDPQENKLRKIKNKVGALTEINKMSRRESIAITRLRMGHTRLTHSYLFDERISQDCICGAINSVEHIFTDCPRFRRNRLKYEIDSINVLASNDLKNYQKIIKFLKDTKLFYEI